MHHSHTIPPFSPPSPFTLPYTLLPLPLASTSSILLSLSLRVPDEWKVVMCHNGGIEDMLTLKDHDLKIKAADILVLVLSEG